MRAGYLLRTIAEAKGRRPHPARRDPHHRPVTVRRLQRTLGNRYVARLLAEDGAAGRAPPDVEEGVERSRGGGGPLEGELREQLQPAFRTELGSVRVHTDAAADRMSRAVHARAFTVGEDVFFRGGEYAPGSVGGRALLAHELAHVDQQRGAPAGPALEVGPHDDSLEREADAVARDVALAQPATPEGADG